MNTNRKGKRQGRTNNNMCSASASASASADTVINKSRVCVQSGLKYKPLSQMSRNNSLHYIRLHWVTRQQQFFFLRKDWDTVLLRKVTG